MEFNKYQRSAATTDQFPKSNSEGLHEGLLVPLLGLAGEVGSLLTQHKKQIRDGAAHKLYREQVAEELGDILWYASNIATKHGLELDDIAEKNLQKTGERWKRDQAGCSVLFPHFFDENFPEGERFPRVFEVIVREVDGQVICEVDGKPAGDPLTDNAYADDGYRFHDVFHFAYVAVLGWSPTIRKLLQWKRRSDPIVDSVEDGGRARVIDEAISALVYAYAKDHSYLETVRVVDYPLLKTIQGLVSHLEVRACPPSAWENAILQGFDAWRVIWKNHGGRLRIDLQQRTIVAY